MNAVAKLCSRFAFFHRFMKSSARNVENPLDLRRQESAFTLPSHHIALAMRIDICQTDANSRTYNPLH
jgi:hypothetical protein